MSDDAVGRGQLNPDAGLLIESLITVVNLLIPHCDDEGKVKWARAAIARAKRAGYEVQHK